MSNVIHLGFDLVKSTQSVVAVITQEGAESIVASLPYNSYEEAATHMAELFLALLPSHRHHLIVTRKKRILNMEFPSHIAVHVPYDSETDILLTAATTKAMEVADAENAANPEPLSKAERKRRAGKPVITAEVYTDASLSRSGSGTGVGGWVERTNGSIDPRFALVTKNASTIDHLETAAIISAIQNNLKVDVLTIHSDSKNAIRTVEALLSGADDSYVGAWSPNGSKLKLKESLNGVEVNLKWVKSHSEDRWNAVTDQMVRFARNCLQKKDADINHVRLLTSGMLKEMITVQVG